MPRDKNQNAEDPRRAFLVKALASGLFAATAWFGPVLPTQAQWWGRRPQQLPPGQSVYEARGPVVVDAQPATQDTLVMANSVIETGSNAQFIFVVGTDAYLLRENSRVELSGEDDNVSSLRLVTGALLSVFGRGEKDLSASTATIGIRGTGLYLEAEPERAYVCTCYGTTMVATADDPSISEQIVSQHHDDPRFVFGPDAEQRIVPAPFINHDDLELMLIEALVGRTPPFSLFDEAYGAPRRRY